MPSSSRKSQKSVAPRKTITGCLKEILNMRAKGNLFVSQNTPVIKRYYHQHIIQESLDLYVSEPETVCHLMIGCPQFAQLNYTDASL